MNTPVSGADLARAEEFAREGFVVPGEDAAAALAEGTARRSALDDALAEIDAGREEPSVEWRRNYSLLLGLERLLAEEEPHLADGTLLNPHQVDALSGTLIALTSELEESLRSGNGRVATANGRAAAEAALESDDLYEDDFVQASLRQADEEPLDDEEDEEPLDDDDEDEAGEPEEPEQEARTRSRSIGTGREAEDELPSRLRAMTREPTAVSGSSTPPGRARRWPRLASSRPPAPAAS